MALKESMAALYAAQDRAQATANEILAHLRRQAAEDKIDPEATPSAASPPPLADTTRPAESEGT